MSVMQALEGMWVVGKAVTQMFLHDERDEWSELGELGEWDERILSCKGRNKFQPWKIGAVLILSR